MLGTCACGGALLLVGDGRVGGHGAREVGAEEERTPPAPQLQRGERGERERADPGTDRRAGDHCGGRGAVVAAGLLVGRLDAE